MVKFPNASGAVWWPNLRLMQVAPSDGQICKFNANGAMLLPNLVQVTESICHFRVEMLRMSKCAMVGASGGLLQFARAAAI